MTLAGNREPTSCRTDAFSSVRPGQGRQPDGRLELSGMPRRSQSPGPEVARRRLDPIGGRRGSNRRDRRRGHRIRTAYRFFVDNRLCRLRNRGKPRIYATDLREV
jgi:hypothetical protein